MSDVDPDAPEVSSFVLLWEGPLGFIYDVAADQKAAFAQRLRALANSLG